MPATEGLIEMKVFVLTMAVLASAVSPVAIATTANAGCNYVLTGQGNILVCR